MAVTSPVIIIAATQMELEACQLPSSLTTIVSGVGPTACGISVVTAIEKYRPELIIQIGIAGAIDRSLNLCDTVFVSSDYFGDMGVWRGETFISFDNTIYNGTNLSLPLVSVAGVTVSTACNPLINRHNASVESMEGAAFYMAAQQFDVKAIQIRSISNYLDTPRSQWVIADALTSLCKSINETINKLL